MSVSDAKGNPKLYFSKDSYLKIFLLRHITVKSIWCKNVMLNKYATGINNVTTNYCKDAKQNVYSIDLKTLNTVINESSQVKFQVETLPSYFGTKNWTSIEKILLLCYKTPTMEKSILMI